MVRIVSVLKRCCDNREAKTVLNVNSKKHIYHLHGLTFIISQDFMLVFLKITKI